MGGKSNKKSWTADDIEKELKRMKKSKSLEEAFKIADKIEKD